MLFSLQAWNSIAGKGCFYLDFSDDSVKEEAQSIIKSQRYHLKLPAPTNVWVEMGVARPGPQEADVLLFAFRTNEDEEATDLITYTQHKVDDVSYSVG